MEQNKKVAELEQEKVWQQEIVFEQKEDIAQKNEFEAIELGIETAEVIEKKKRREVIFEMALFFVLGILLGVTIKSEAMKRITIGFNDYQITKIMQSYDIADLKKNLNDKLTKQQDEQQAVQQSTSPTPDGQEPTVE